ncbi:C-type lectin domain family 4 member G-like isoform X3 [Rhinatrema bivittatum]|uniref:C-type lectin domain family 4 member G-like isoform X3 n=1 Tax=Rhinatrema bivittatum TaxID=194408 RepID=UPI00112652A2|nr:C-type lectin domain family 4 member G-like isoform X3 [Rhinatrema bivittatum]
MDKQNVYGNMSWIPPKPETGGSQGSDGDYENEAVSDAKRPKPRHPGKASRPESQDKSGKAFHGLEISTIEVPPSRPPRAGLNLSSAAVERAFRAPSETPSGPENPRKPTALYFLLALSLLLSLVLGAVAFVKFWRISEELERLHAGYSGAVRNVSVAVAEVRTEQGKGRTDMERALQELQDDGLAKGLQDAREDREKIRSKVEKEVAELRKAIDLSCTLCQCPQDWQWNLGSCYFFSTDTESWEAAQQFCISKSSYLLIVEEDETSYLLEHTKSHNYWIGLSRKGQDWIWVDGTPLQFSKWSEGEPNNMAKREHCAELYASGRWNDLDCSMKRPWICEKK